ncbi:MAG: CoA-binding protein [Chloroflexi bacterium]|nr:CoA-binding protein [Chloroflexota bacterium]
MTRKAQSPPDLVELEGIFQPRSIAVVGASANPDSPGHDYVSCLQQFGYQGPIYPVNPRASEILGLLAYPSLQEIPGPVDYVVSCVPASAVLEVVDDCAAKGVKALQLFTGRFSETGRPEAADLEKRLLQRARAAGVRIIGPNCLGLLYPRLGISFRTDMPREPGSVGFLSQSGNLLFELTYLGGPRGLRFSKAMSYGNGLDLSEADFLDYFGQDSETEVIGAYIEGVRDGRRFLAALKRAAAAKPAVILKGGRTTAGGRSAASHTAALAGARDVWDAALAQAGAVGVDTVEELVDMLLAFAFMKPPSTRSERSASRTAQGERGGRRPDGLPYGRLAMVGGGGGRSVLTADLGEELGLSVPPLPEDVQQKIAEKAPDLAGWITNPVDQSILAGSGLGGAQVLEWLDESPGIDLLLTSVGEGWSLGRPNAQALVSRVSERFAQVGSRTAKPFAVVLAPSDYAAEWQWRLISEARERLTAAGLAVYPSPERAVRALARFVAYWEERP